MAQDPYKYFRVEARELVDQLGKAVLDLEKGPAPELAARLLRLAHTLKGAARVVKQSAIADQAHAIEDALAPFRGSAVPVPRNRIDAVLRLLDEIGSRVGSLAPPHEPEAVAAGRIRPEEPFRTIRTDVREMDALLDGVAEAHAQLSSLQRNLATVERARYLLDLLAGQVGARRTPENRRPGNGVPSDKARSVAEELQATLARLERALASGADQIDRELRQVRVAAERLRLVPAGSLFTWLERTARDAAQALGKHVLFEGRGGDVRLDAHVLSALQAALLQVVRNAVAHGIEVEADRRAAGKSPDGRVTLDVVPRGRRVAFTCADDGRGVDLEAVRRAIQRKGLLSAETQRLGPEELLRMLLEGGISTSGAVSEVSGRGIGLDVVREAADRLGGDVRVRTQAGKGTTVEIVVPLSLASLEALVVEASGVAAAIPLDAVRRTLRIARRDMARTVQGESVIYEGKAISFLPLLRALSAKPLSVPGTRSWSAVIVKGASGVVAVGVDRLLGTGRVVLRPLPDAAPAGPVVAGAFLDGEGNPQLVLDPDGLVSEARGATVSESENAAPRPPVLVIDDSLTTRMLEQSILESAGYEVDLATSGEEALEKARRKRYALFLVDIEMPGMDGFTFIEWTRANPTVRDIPCILVTSSASPEDRRRGEEVGASAYIVKSEFNQGELLERIRKLVG